MEKEIFEEREDCPCSHRAWEVVPPLRNNIWKPSLPNVGCYMWCSISSGIMFGWSKTRCAALVQTILGRFTTHIGASFRRALQLSMWKISIARVPCWLGMEWFFWSWLRWREWCDMIKKSQLIINHDSKISNTLGRRKAKLPSIYYCLCEGSQFYNKSFLTTQFKCK